MRKKVSRLISMCVVFIFILQFMIPAYSLTTPNVTELIRLSFENTLADSIGKNAVSSSKTVTYVDGIATGNKAVNLTNNTFLNLGTSPLLNPQDLTVSFWVRPNVAMGSGEQIFVWNKNQYYSDGWYISSENNNTPIAVSIGPGSSSVQPYMTKVLTARDAFFPAGEWTHVVVSYDNASKEVKVYRNGVQQATSVVYAMSATATGVIGDSGVTKSIGYNEPYHASGGYANYALVEFLLYDKALSQADVVELYSEGATVDPAEFLKADHAALSIPTTTERDIYLPATGKNGSSITWKSSNPSIIADYGKVSTLYVDEETTVIMTATLSYNGEQMTKTFEVVVTAPLVPASLRDSGMDNVSLADPYLVNATNKEIDYLMELDAEMLLYEYYRVAGVAPKTSSGYSGWETNSGNNFRGFTLGRYMAALLQIYIGAQNPTVKANILAKIKQCINGLKECQDTYAAANPTKAGYISSFPETRLDNLQNAILSSHNPETGMFTYFQPMGSGYNKVFSTKFDRFWCCVGTGMDSFSKLNDSLYFAENSDVYVNMYYSSEYRYPDQNLKLTGVANMPNSDAVKFTVDSIDGNAVAANANIFFRTPDWCDGVYSVSLNGSPVSAL